MTRFACNEFFQISYNYPNPFNPIITIYYELPESGFVNITIYDIMGREVKILENTIKMVGHKKIRWNAINSVVGTVSAGLYFYRIKVGGYTQTKKMVLLK